MFHLSLCVGDACCSDGLVYDSSLNQCITSTGDSYNTTNTDTDTDTNTNTNTDTNTRINTTETFANNIFTKLANSYKKPDVILGGDNIKSNNSNSFINYSKF